jgi:Zn-dependent protease with chaperone function
MTSKNQSEVGVLIRRILNNVWDIIRFFIYPVRVGLLIALILMGFMSGFVIAGSSQTFRIIFAYGYVMVMCLTLYCYTNVYTDLALNGIRIFYKEKKYRKIEYKTAEIDNLKQRTGFQDVKVYVTTNPAVKSAFTNLFTKCVYIPQHWLQKFPSKEISSIVAHELGHLIEKRSSVLKLLLPISLVNSLGLFLYRFTLPLIASTTLTALSLILMSLVSRHNELRADSWSAKLCGPEGIISVLEQLKAEGKRNYGSETHPSLTKRIRRLMEFLG